MKYEHRNSGWKLSARSIPLLFTILISFHMFAQDTVKITDRYTNDFEDSIRNMVWMNPNTIIQGKESGKDHFSRTDKNNPYSSGIEIELPGELKRKNFSIAVKGLIRLTNVDANNQLVISISRGDSAIFWKGEHLPDTSGKVNQWNNFSYSCLIPRNIPKDSKVKIFVWNADGKSETDIDNFDITFKETEFPSSLPE